MLTDFDAILLAISKVDLEAAEASVQSDKDTILTLIRETMGFHQVNKDVLKVLREWLVDTALQHLKDVLKQAYICDGLILEADTARPVLLLNKVALLLQTLGSCWRKQSSLSVSLAAGMNWLCSRARTWVRGRCQNPWAGVV